MCVSCQMAKSSRLPFSASQFVATRPLERIHCDVWGPSPVVSVQGFKYYVVLIDNYSRYCSMYPMKKKSDFHSIFVAFQLLVQNPFQTTIVTFQCDGGGEFISNQFLLHLQNNGIQQLLSCPHTPQQNCLAERRHKHIVELGLSLLFQSRAPQKYWVEAFTTVNFLSNLLPHSANSNTSPYEMLHDKSPTYDALRIFGCACFPMMRPYTQNKLDPRSLKCVFLGYSKKYKGYRCLLLVTGRVYISRHVIFDESKFPFADMYGHLHPQAATPLMEAWLKSNSSAASQSQSTPTQGRPETMQDRLCVIKP